MKATRQLKEEHQAVKLSLSILERIHDKLAGGEQIEGKHLVNLCEFLQVFVDKCHHSKEEQVLFPALEQAGIPKEGGPIGMMLIEHDEGRGYVKNLAEEVKKYSLGDKKAVPKIVKNINNYTSFLRDHIDKEDNILYQIADIHLSPRQDQQMIKSFKRIEDTQIGVGKHEQFHQMLDSLKKIYF